MHQVTNVARILFHHLSLVLQLHLFLENMDLCWCYSYIGWTSIAATHCMWECLWKWYGSCSHCWWEPVSFNIIIQLLFYKSYSVILAPYRPQCPIHHTGIDLYSPKLLETRICEETSLPTPLFSYTLTCREVILRILLVGTEWRAWSPVPPIPHPGYSPGSVFASILPVCKDGAIQVSF